MAAIENVLMNCGVAYVQADSENKIRGEKVQIEVSSPTVRSMLDWWSYESFFSCQKKCNCYTR